MSFLQYLDPLVRDNLLRTLALHGDLPSHEVLCHLREGLEHDHGLSPQEAHATIFEAIPRALGLEVIS